MGRALTGLITPDGKYLRRRLTHLSTVWWFVMGIAALVLIPIVSLAGPLTGRVESRELVSIGTVLAQPSSYHMQIIRMHGVVRHVEILIPHDPYQPGDPCYGSYTFTLEDETGAIDVGVLGDRLHCGTPGLAAAPEVAEGDQVIVHGQIHAPGEYVDKMTSPLPVYHANTQVLAIQISHPLH
ncbi:MAG: hypothetical protein Q8S75_15035 [Nitrospirota bacterium]|nr:hypothetical protein [Nitrospirota bacterium]